MDEQAEAAQLDADRLGESFLYTVIDEDSFGSAAVVASHGVTPKRQVFDRASSDTPRTKLEGDLSVRAQLAGLKKGRL